MKKLLPFAAAFALLALMILGIALLSSNFAVSNGTRDGAKFVSIAAPCSAGAVGESAA